ncbi:Putative methylesterase 6 [Cytospora mali]|uniref:Methylesterase 6 n=1 Tax=Cytospora mali TaxID=578113 RepID=A0A194W4S5_CYTMA|nr:Putative methylesterase 6 [Valsa mali]
MASDKPVILLVHEAFHRPVHYEEVLSALRAKGFAVAAPELPTTGTDPRLTYEDDVAAVGAVLEPLLNEGREVVIVAHSFGSLPASHCIEGESVAERAECGLKGGIKHYINVCGLAYPRRGRNIVGAEDECPLQDYHLIQDGLIHIQDSAKTVLHSDLRPEQVEDIWKTIVKTHSQKNFNSHPKFVDKEIRVPKTYVFCEDDLALPMEYQTYFIRVGGYEHVIRVPSGHFPFLKIPVRMVEIISGIAERE